MATVSQYSYQLIDWGHVTEAEALNPEKNAMFVYVAAKILAEKAQWQFVKEHPQLDVVSSKSSLASAFFLGGSQ